MDTISRALFNNSDNLLINEGLDILRSITKGGGFRACLQRLLNALPKILAMIILKQIITDPISSLKLLQRLCWLLFKSCLYERQYLHCANSDDTHLMRTLLTDNTMLVNGLPIYVEHHNDNANIYIIPKLHGNYINNLRNEVKVASKVGDEIVSILYSYGVSYNEVACNDLFATHNFLDLQRIIQAEIDTACLLQRYSVFGILIDGEPGLGKSSFIEYIARQNIVQKVYHVTMSQQEILKTESKRILKDVFSNIPINHSAIFMIDEVDKYLDYRINKTYEDALQEVANRKLSSNSSEIDNTQAETYHIDRVAHARQIRVDFLYSILAMLERQGLVQPCIVIFCSNNFDSLFSDLDMTHFQAIKDRFTRVQFRRMNKSDVLEYLQFHNEKFLGSDYYQPNLMQLAESLPNDLDITVRKLQQMAKLMAFDFAALIERLQSCNSPRHNEISGSWPTQETSSSSHAASSYIQRNSNYGNILATSSKPITSSHPTNSKPITSPRSTKTSSKPITSSRPTKTSNKPITSSRSTKTSSKPITSPRSTKTSSKPITSSSPTNNKPKYSANLIEKLITGPAMIASRSFDEDSRLSSSEEAEAMDDSSECDSNNSTIIPNADCKKVNIEINGIKFSVSEHLSHYFHYDYNDDVPENEYLYAFNCSNCQRVKLSGQGFCNCAGCIKYCDISQYCRGNIVDTKCHECRNQICWPRQNFTKEIIKESKRISEDIKEFVHIVECGSCEYERKIMTVALFTYMSEYEQLRILNTVAYNKFRPIIWRKLLEFFNDHPGFISANHTPFDIISAKLLPGEM